MKKVTLRPGRERRILDGHRWIFSNEIDGTMTDIDAGSWVEVVTSRGVILGSGYMNPHSLIAIRLVCPPGRRPNREFFEERVRKAVELRRLCYPHSHVYRVLFGESDGLPGLIVDRYDGVLVVQVTTVGMELLEPLWLPLLIETFHPETVVYRNDNRGRLREGLALEKRVAYGRLPELLKVSLHGFVVEVDPWEGQKTGLFLDQRENREALRKWVQGKKVLDLFCYEGTWSLVAASAGAREVVGVDRSDLALRRARRNATANGLADRCRFVRNDAVEYLRKIQRESQDIIIADPPAFARTKKDLPGAMKAYVNLNRRCLLGLRRGGILVTSSCSYHLSEDRFREVLVKAGKAAGREVRILHVGSQSPDHPVLAAMPETRYLKCFFAQAH